MEDRRNMEDQPKATPLRTGSLNMVAPWARYLIGSCYVTSSSYGFVIGHGEVNFSENWFVLRHQVFYEGSNELIGDYVSFSRPSVRPSVRPSIHPSVRPSVHAS